MNGPESAAPVAKSMRRGHIVLWTILVAYLLAFGFLVTQSNNPQAAQVATYFLLLFMIVLAAVITLVRCGFPRAQGFGIAVVLAAFVWLAHTPHGFVSFSGIVAPALTFLATLACVSARAAHPMMPAFLKDHSQSGVWKSIGLGILVGLLLGAINIPLGLTSGESLNLGFDYARLVTPLSPAIHEEVSMRAVFLAMAVAIMHGRLKSVVPVIWGLMTLPHLFPHISASIGTQPLAETGTSLAILFVLFSVPLVLLQRRRDLTTAMVAHGVIDLVRFCLLGLPF